VIEPTSLLPVMLAWTSVVLYKNFLWLSVYEFSGRGLYGMIVGSCQ